jgi:uncharacterized protein YndB with AHSA1/START domain
MKSMTIEPRVGGRWIERGTDGSETVAGKVLVWEPPHRFIVSWDIDGSWKPDPLVGSEVEVRFVAQGPSETLVELEHRKFERMQPEGGRKLRGDVDRGWPGMLDLFRSDAERFTQPEATE